MTTEAATITHDPAWTALSAMICDEAPMIADRDDLLVTIAPGAGHGHPACFLPSQATIEIDAAHFAADPATARPYIPADRARYATAWGLLVHECAHARYSHWNTPPDTPSAVREAALTLEEARIEGAHIARRPDDRQWLRAAITQTFSVGSTDTTVPAAARTAALLLARVDAGILTTDETTRVATDVETIIGTDLLNTLRTIWCEALTIADNDHTSMLALGQRWIDAVGESSEEPLNAANGENRLSSPVHASVQSLLTKVASTATPTPTASSSAPTEAGERKPAARKVFSRDPDHDGPTSARGTRSATLEERRAARALASALTTAGVRERTKITVTSALPPGRLRMRGALTADAQRAAGAIPTAEPFTRTARRPASTPPLRIGIACDVSASMRDFAAPVASAAWILSSAAQHTSTPTTTATVIFGDDVRPITRPGQYPERVTEFNANDRREKFDLAINALDEALDLSEPGAARLLVIISDGRFKKSQSHSPALIRKLQKTGCAILWIIPNPESTPYPGVTTHLLDNPQATARMIGQAATNALRATQ